MSIPTQSGLWSFAPQPEKIGDGSNFDISVLDWYKYRSPRVGLGTLESTQIFPLEVGGINVPTGAFKDMQMYGGDVDILPRLEGSIGYLLTAAIGSCTTTSNKDIYGNDAVGVYTHKFVFDPTSSFRKPWLASRCLMPGQTSAEDGGEIGIDCKIGNLTMTIPQMGKVSMRATIQGRETHYDNDPSSWTYANASFDSTETVADAGRGQFLIEGQEYPALGASVEFADQLTGPQQEMVIGSFHPENFIGLTRSMMIRFAYKFENDALSRRIFTGTSNGTEFNPLPYLAKTVGNTPALDIYFEAPSTIGSTGKPHAMRVVANNIVLARDGYPELTAGDIITENYTLTVLEPSTGDYFAMYIQNGTSNYTWPTGDTNPVVVLADALSYTGASVALGATATLTDADSLNLDTGTLTVQLAGTNLADDDSVSVVASGDVTVMGANVYHNSVLVGTMTGDGNTGTPLVVTFNSVATAAIAQDILRTIEYDRTSGSTPADEVTAEVTVTDGDGGTSASDTVTITHS